MRFILDETKTKIKLIENKIIFDEPNTEYFERIKASSKIYKNFKHKYSHVQYRSIYSIETESKVNNYFYDLSFTTKNDFKNIPSRKFLYNFSRKNSEGSFDYYEQYLNFNQSTLYTYNKDILIPKINYTNSERINFDTINQNFTKIIRDSLIPEISNSVIRDYSISFKNCFKYNYNNFQSCKDFLWINMESSGYNEIAFQLVLFKSSVG